MLGRTILSFWNASLFPETSLKFRGVRETHHWPLGARLTDCSKKTGGLMESISKLLAMSISDLLLKVVRKKKEKSIPQMVVWWWFYHGRIRTKSSNKQIQVIFSLRKWLDSFQDSRINLKQKQLIAGQPTPPNVPPLETRVWWPAFSKGETNGFHKPWS